MYLINKIKQNLPGWIRKSWYQPHVAGWLWILWPFSLIYQGIRYIKRRYPNKTYRSKLPVIVVGNITVGGNGKTPAILSLIELLTRQGYHPGVVSRGYPVNPIEAILVASHHSAHDVGDEPLLIYSKTKVPVVVCKDRAKAIQLLEQTNQCDVILSDDGLQNLSFHHDIEVVMVDAKDGFGNCCLLPMGPLRDPISRLSTVDFVVERVIDQKAAKKDYSDPSHTGFIINFEAPVNLKTWLQAEPQILPSLVKGQKLYAVTAIANPQSFFDALKQLGFTFEAHAYPDHYPLSSSDFEAMSDGQIIMTEKDAVKCLDFADGRYWCLPMTGHMSKTFEEQMLKRLITIQQTNHSTRESEIQRSAEP